MTYLLTYPDLPRMSMLVNVEEAICELASHGIFTLGLGGDHLVAYPAIKALAQKYGKLSLIHFDAHTAYGYCSHALSDAWQYVLICGRRRVN